MSTNDPSTTHSAENPLTQEVINIAAQMVDSCGGDGSLDYSEGSLAVVEELLADAADYTDGMSEEQLGLLVEGFGCYILEVGRRNVGGRYLWMEQRDQPVLVFGEPDFEVSMITWDRVRERLSGDPAAAIPFFYEGFASRARSAEPGTRALYV